MDYCDVTYFTIGWLVHEIGGLNHARSIWIFIVKHHWLWGVLCFFRVKPSCDANLTMGTYSSWRLTDGMWRRSSTVKCGFFHNPLRRKCLQIWTTVRIREFSRPRVGVCGTKEAKNEFEPIQSFVFLALC